MTRKVIKMWVTLCALKSCSLSPVESNSFYKCIAYAYPPTKKHMLFIRRTPPKRNNVITDEQN